MAKKTNLNSLKKVIVPILKKNGVVKAGIFGSVARGEATKKSDVDVLIKFRGKKSLLDVVGLKLELEETIHRNVDVLTYKALHPALKDRILHEEVRIL